MSSDAVVWNVINDHFCSFKVKTKTDKFCKNEYNVTGKCNQESCPLANSRYATVKEVDGVLYLYMKTIERAHTPAKLWERVKLNKNYAQALQQIDDQLIYWPQYMIHRCKQRLTRLTQYLIKMRRLTLRANTKLVPINRRLEKRDETRETKAELAAKLDSTIQKELLERLRNGTYGEMYKDILNVDQNEFEEAMDALEDEMVSEFEEDFESDEGEYEREIVSEHEAEMLEESDYDDMEDYTAASQSETEGSIASSVVRRRPYVEVEYEMDAAAKVDR